MTEFFFQVYAQGMCYTSLCTNLTDEVAADRLNIEFPTGLDDGIWRLSADTSFKTGEPHPAPCDRRSDCRHLLFECATLDHLDVLFPEEKSPSSGDE